jgi:hypothetical protein
VSTDAGCSQVRQRRHQPDYRGSLAADDLESDFDPSFDAQVLDLNTLQWAELPLQGLHPCAGHQLVNYGGSILLVGGNGKRHNAEPVSHVAVRMLDETTGCWQELKCGGTPPSVRGGHSATLVGDLLVVFGGEDDHRRVQDDLHVLDLLTCTWSQVRENECISGSHAQKHSHRHTSALCLSMFCPWTPSSMHMSVLAPSSSRAAQDLRFWSCPCACVALR